MAEDQEARPRRLTRARCLLAAAPIVAGLVYLLAPRAYPAPDLSEVPRATSPLAPRVRTPAIDAHNPLLAICVGPCAAHAGCTEVSLVFLDEDQPSWVGDRVYDLFRWYRYGRIADVETFHATAEGYDLTDVYAGEQPFDVRFAEHFDRTVGAAELGSPPTLYASTWNHMLRPTPGGGVTEWVTPSVPLLALTRAQLEERYAAVWTPR